MPEEKAALEGLNCPKCGGILPIPEGEVIVHCPYCDLRSVVSGEHGLKRYQVAGRIDRQKAVDAVYGFLGGHMGIATDARRKDKVTETFLAYLPFWAGWGRVLAWGFGERKVGSGDNERYEPREVRVVEEMSWNGAACDVGEFGVSQVPLNDQQLQPYNVDSLHRSGLVFEPVGSTTDADTAAKQSFAARVQGKLGLDRVSQVFTRTVRPRLGLVYYPLWVTRYTYRSRTFQVVVDGATGQVLYGRAPGNNLYRAGVLVAGMASGALIGIDLPALILSGSNNSHSNNLPVFAIGLFIFGLGLMWAAYRTFRYGEQYELRSGPKQVTGAVGSDLLSQFTKAASILEKLQ
jgi:hypothetical protein